MRERMGRGNTAASSVAEQEAEKWVGTRDRMSFNTQMPSTAVSFGLPLSSKLIPIKKQLMFMTGHLTPKKPKNTVTKGVLT